MESRRSLNHGKPVAHLFKLEVSNHDIEVFHQAGVNNLSTSYQNEDGTLAMYASKITENPNQFIVLRYIKMNMLINNI